MFEAFSAIVGVPGAIDATLNIIQKIRNAITGTSGEQVSEEDLNAITDQLSGVKNILGEFAVSFDELDAWKQVHNISNNLRNIGFDKSFSYIGRARDRHDFETNVYNSKEVKGDMIADIRGLNKEKQAGVLLKIYAQETNLHKHVESLKEVEDGPDKKEWHIRISELISIVNSAVVETGAPKDIFDALTDLVNYLDLCNTVADDNLIKGLSEYSKVIEALRKSLD